MSNGQYLSQVQQQRMQLTLAPQLRQSLEVLQLPILDLQTVVRQELEQNPTLEESPGEKDRVEIEPLTDPPELAQGEAEFDEQYAHLAQLDDEWRDYFRQNAQRSAPSPDEDARRQFMMESLSAPVSLQEHLRAQLAHTDLDEAGRRLGELLIGSLNEDGYLVTPLEELAATSGQPDQELADVLTVIQEFDPVGVGARDLGECLRIQLRRLGKADTPADWLVRDHLETLAAHRYDEIAKRLHISLTHTHELARFIATLEPRPGRAFGSDRVAYVLPEIFIRKQGAEWVITINDDQLPHLHISRHYRTLMENPETPAEVKRYVREKIQSGAFLIKSLHQRQQTLRRMAERLVHYQSDFFEHGVTHLRPLTMAQVAADLELHETTISRAIANKYADTPQGLYDLKYFFTPGYQRADGQTVSNMAVKEAIRQLVGHEDPAAPLADQDLSARLAAQGLKVARRTVAKYREQLGLLPSHLRRGARRA
ncbi:MAG: RNA polymerase factor sigma-54 [Candidatus Marinimicrobia bacterium]|nr:RNA polymerase factor sigma-54 [Candidatus Neomarinimicrobiota bacterium]